jgi:hypothetical protein
LADDPLARRRILGSLAHQLHHLCGRLAFVQADHRQLGTDLHHVVVAVKDAGDDGTPAQFNPAGVGPSQVSDFRACANGQETTIFDSQRLGDGALGIQGIDLGVGQDQVW